MKSNLTLSVVWLGGSVGWLVGWWLEIWRLRLISTQVVVEVEVGVELGKMLFCCKYEKLGMIL